MAAPAPEAAEPAAGRSPISDEDLIRRYAASGDVTAFRILMERHRPMLRRLLAALFHGNREDMADAEQEVLIALSNALPRFRFGSSYPTFLYRVARNTAVSLLRRRRREDDRVLLAPLMPEEAAAADPAVTAVGRWRQERLRAALGRLDPEDRLLVVLRDVEDVPVRELARVTGLPEGTVKSRLHRARGKLARAMGGADHD